MSNKGIIVLFFIIGSIAPLFFSGLFPADDGFFYLHIANKIALGNGSEFFVNIPTNGYHPLWMLILSGFSLILPKSIQLNFALFVQIVLFGFVLWRISNLLINLSQFTTAIIFTCILGFIFLGTGTLFLSEAFLSLLILVLILERMYFWQKNLQDTFVLSLLFGLAFLARLDNAIVLMPMIFFILWSLKNNLKLAFLFIITGLITIAPYFYFNSLFFDTLIPISGIIKNRFPELTMSVADKSGAVFGLATLFPFLFVKFKNSNTDKNLTKVDNFVFLLYLGGVLQYAICYFFQESYATWYWTSIYFSFAYFSARWIGSYSLMKYNLAIFISGVILVIFFQLKRFNDFRTSDSWYNSKHPVEQFALELNEILPAGSSIFTYDSPGRLAYFTEINFLSADGLISNKSELKMVEEISFKQYLAAKNIDYILLPKIDGNSYKRLSLELAKKENGEVVVNYFSPLTKNNVGSIELKASQIKFQTDNPLRFWQSKYSKIVVYKLN